MKVKIIENFEKEFFGNKEVYTLNHKVIFEKRFFTFRKTLSFVILASKDFNLEKVKAIVNEIENLKMLFNLDVVFVVGNKSDLLLLNGEYKDKFYKGVISEKVNAPVFASFKCGLKAVSEESLGVFLIFANRKEEKSENLLKIFSGVTSEKSIVVPVKLGKKTHPILFSKALIKDLLSLRKEKGIPYVLKKYSNLINLVSIE